MEGKDIAIYSIGGVLLLTGIGVGVYFLIKPVSVEKLSTTGTRTVPNAGGQTQDTSNSQAQSTSSSSSQTSQPSYTPTPDSPEQIAYDIATYGYSDQFPAGSFPLVLASKNKLVWDIQNALNTVWGANIVADGNMGEETLKAICSYVFEFCISTIPRNRYRQMKIQKDLYTDILAGKTRYDLFLPT